MKAPFIFAPLSTVVLTACFLLPAAAQKLPPLPIQFNPDRLVNLGRPDGRRRGGGSPDDCPSSSSSGPSLTAIAYARTLSELGTKRTDETTGALTTQARPTLWFYLPTALSSQTATSFALKDSRDQLLYEGQIAGETNGDGIISVPVPVDLAVGSPYHWSLTVGCGTRDASDQATGGRATVDGWIERQASDSTLNRDLSQADSRNRAALYANYGFLQDATTELAALRLASREDASLAQDWVDFLANLDLRDLTAAPLLECCGLVDARSPQPETAPAQPEISEPDGELAEPEPAQAEPDQRTILQRARDRR